MADRRRQVLLLLASRFDGLYLPHGFRTPAGLVPSVREPCAVCGGRGVVVDRFRREQPCGSCGAAGWVARDPMDAFGVRVGSVSTSSSARPRRSVVCDACEGAGAHGNGRRCEVCGGEGRRDLHVFELRLDLRDVEERDPMLSAIVARNASGSYVELERALVGLWAVDSRAALQLLACVDEDRMPGFEDAHYLVVERGLRFLVERMPDPVRVPAEVVANDRERREWRRRVKGRGVSVEALRRRDAEIRRAVRGGVPAQRVAFEYGLSVSQVYRVVRAEAA